ncbi:hypothetical protein AABB24_014225 [Solanum stoloniferum]|uniref:Uncharacterized protein n=1 Tax=Solanum stoloniferum TaxID=62892 RepID=A0ABD2TXQ4_9SOLN
MHHCFLPKLVNPTIAGNYILRCYFFVSTNPYLFFILSHMIPSESSRTPIPFPSHIERAIKAQMPPVLSQPIIKVDGQVPKLKGHTSIWRIENWAKGPILISEDYILLFWT